MSDSLQRSRRGGLATLVWLAVVSTIVGFVFVTLNIDPVRIVDGLINNFDEALRLLWESLGSLSGLVRHIWRYCLAGAVVVVPIWLIMRIIERRRGR